MPIFLSSHPYHFLYCNLDHWINSWIGKVGHEMQEEARKCWCKVSDAMLNATCKQRGFGGCCSGEWQLLQQTEAAGFWHRPRKPPPGTHPCSVVVFHTFNWPAFSEKLKSAKFSFASTTDLDSGLGNPPPGTRPCSYVVFDTFYWIFILCWLAGIMRRTGAKYDVDLRRSHLWILDSEP